MFTEEERAKFKKRFLRWKETRKRLYEAGIPIEVSDNTRVNRQEVVEPIKRDFIAEALRKHAAEAVGPDTRSSYLQKQSQAAKQYANQQYLKAKDDAKRAEGLELIMATVSPSTYVEAATGKDLGEAGRFAVDVGIFGLPNMIKSAAKKAIAPAARYMTNAKNFTFGINLGEPLQKPMLALPSPQQSHVIGSIPPEATYTGRIPSKILDIKSVLQKNRAKQMLSDIANDPNDYTFEEISDVLNKAYLNEGTVPIEIPSSGKTIQLGNNVLKELLKVNAILKRYGYEEIPEGMDDVATRLAVLDRAAEHRLFGRGVYLKPRGSEADKAITKLASKAFGVPEELVTAEMKLQTAATHTVAGEAENGRQGLNDALNHYGLHRRGLPYDAIYTSNRDAVMAGYSNPGYGNGSKGLAYLVQMPVNDTPNASLTELWENNEFPIMRDYDGKLTLWRTHELPYMLKTGKGFDESALRQNPKYKDIVDRYDALFERNKAILEGQKIKYSDTTPSLILKLKFFSQNWDVFDHNFSPFYEKGLIRKPYLDSDGFGMTVEEIEDLIARNYAFLRQFVKPIQPVVERKLGAIKGVRNKLGKISTSDAQSPFLADDEEEFYQPAITQVTMKYPRAYKRFSDGLAAISKFLESAAIRDYKSMFNFADRMYNLGIITEKLFKAIKNSLKGEHPNPEKYIDIANAVKLALRNYFKSLGKERSADAFARKTYVERHNKELDNTVSALKETNKYEKERELKEIKKQYFELLMSEVGVKPNYSKKSKDGYRVFTTEGIRMPDPKDTKGTHFVVVGPKDTKLLDIKGKYYPKSNRKHHGHEGLRVPGLSRNLGGYLMTPFLGAAAYMYNLDR